MGEQAEIPFEEIEKEIVGITTAKTKARSSKESRLLAFKEILNKKPSNKFLKTNEHYGNKYIPIEILERILSALFYSYQFVVKTPPIVEQGNIIFFVDVVVVNPVTMLQETFTGVSATPIMPRNGSFTDIHPHIPAAKSFAIMNGCKHIGRLFRAENDKCTDIFDSYFEKKKEEVVADPLEIRINKMIDSCKTREEMTTKVGSSSDKYESTKKNFLTKWETLKK